MRVFFSKLFILETFGENTATGLLRTKHRGEYLDLSVKTYKTAKQGASKFVPFT